MTSDDAKADCLCLKSATIPVIHPFSSRQGLRTLSVRTRGQFLSRLAKTLRYSLQRARPSGLPLTHEQPAMALDSRRAKVATLPIRDSRRRMRCAWARATHDEYNGGGAPSRSENEGEETRQNFTSWCPGYFWALPGPGISYVSQGNVAPPPFSSVSVSP